MLGFVLHIDLSKLSIRFIVALVERFRIDIMVFPGIKTLELLNNHVHVIDDTQRIALVRITFFLVHLHLDAIAKGVIADAQVNRCDLIGTVGHPFLRVRNALKRLVRRYGIRFGGTADIGCRADCLPVT